MPDVPLEKVVELILNRILRHVQLVKDTEGLEVRQTKRVIEELESLREEIEFELS